MNVCVYLNGQAFNKSWKGAEVMMSDPQPSHKTTARTHMSNVAPSHRHEACKIVCARRFHLNFSWRKSLPRKSAVVSCTPSVTSEVYPCNSVALSYFHFFAIMSNNFYPQVPSTGPGLAPEYNQEQGQQQQPEGQGPQHWQGQQQQQPGQGPMPSLPPGIQPPVLPDQHQDPAIVVGGDEHTWIGCGRSWQSGVSGCTW